MNIYRIIQEAVNNALKYAKAKEIIVDFKSDQTNTVISIMDDGIGFDLNTTKKGNGMHNIQKRAQDIGARVQIESVVGTGTTIRLLLN